MAYGLGQGTIISLNRLLGILNNLYTSSPPLRVRKAEICEFYDSQIKTTLPFFLKECEGHTKLLPLKFGVQESFDLHMPGKMYREAVKKASGSMARCMGCDHTCN